MISIWASSSVPTLCSEMFQIKPYADKPSAFGLSVHSFVSYERIGKWDEDRYRKAGKNPYALGWENRWGLSPYLPLLENISIGIIALGFERAVSFLQPIPAFPFGTIPQSSHTGYMQQMLLHKLRF